MRKKIISFYLLALPAFAAYNNVRPIVIPHSRVSADLTAFPMVVAGTYPYLATAANGGNVQNANGYDIAFTSDSGCSSLLKFERVYWSATDGNVEFHVNIPVLSHTSDTTIYLCYGNSSISSDQQNVTGTWDTNYTSVFHFPNGSALSYADSTRNIALSATGPASPSAFAGKMNGGAWLNNSAGGVSLSGASSDLTNPGPKTFEAWIKPTSFQSSAWPTGIIVYGKSSNVIYSMQLVSDGNGTDRVPAFTIDNGSSFQAADGRPISPSTWHHLVGITAPGNVYIYVDGVQYSAPASTPKPGDSSFKLVIGQDAYDDNLQSYFNGLIDEVRVSNVARSAVWIAAEYANQADPNAFYTIGTPLSNSSNFANVSVIGSTNTQAIIRFTYTPGNVGSCTVAVSRNASLYPLVNDVNTALFVNANVVSRDSANLINGNSAQIVVGKRYKAYYATDGSRYSRALKQNAAYYYNLNCGGDSYSGSFSTRPLAMGDTHLDGIPSDSNNPGAPAWPSPTGFVRCNTTDTGCSTSRRDTDYIDPQTGVLIKHLVMPDDNILTDAYSRAALVTPAGAGWTIPDGWANSNSSSASISNSTNPLVIGVWNNNAFKWGDVISGPNYSSPVMMQFFITASLTNSACTGSNNSPDCRIDVCVTLNWQTCVPKLDPPTYHCPAAGPCAPPVLAAEFGQGVSIVKCNESILPVTR